MDKADLRVLIIPSWYFKPGKGDIAGQMFHHEARALREAGIEARIYYADLSWRGPVIRSTSRREEDGVPTTRVSQWFPPKYSFTWFQRWRARYVKLLVRHFDREGLPDIIHAQSYLAACVCAGLLKKYQIPFIYSERNSKWITTDIPRLAMPLIHEGLQKAAAITCVSPGLKKRMDVQTDKHITIIPPSFDERIFNDQSGIEKEKTFTWISVGEPARIKGLDLIIRAFAKFTGHVENAQLVLVDQIPQQKELMALASSLNIASKIKFTGLISQYELADLYRKSHAYVSASQVETFGKAMIEAMACGLPVVATPTDGAQYIQSVTHQVNLLSSFTAQELIDAMQDTYEQYSTFDATAISNAARHFRKSNVIPQWVGLYKSIIP